MLKIRDNVKFEKLKEYGFKKEPEGQYYYKKIQGGEIFVWCVNSYDYKKRYVYIELEYCEMVICDLDILYILAKDNILERCT